MIRSIVAVFCAILSLGCAPSISAMNLQEGQVWLLKGSSADERILIGKIEMIGELEVVSVRISDVPVPDPDPSFLNGRSTTVLQHIPFSRQALLDSVDELILDDQVIPDDFWEGYVLWKEAVDNGQAGIFTETVPKTLTVIFNTLR